MTTHALKNFITGLPSKPGIYRFKDARKKDLYIGKATNLKNRVSSYLPSRQAGLKTTDTRIIKMASLAHSLEFVPVESEIEALILESQLIKKFRPQFNVMLRDDKQYFYVVISNDKFPKIFWTHQPHDGKFKGSYFIGPFTDGNILKSTLHFLRRVFPYCICKSLHNNFCLNYHIGKCPGFCCLKKPSIDDSQLATYKENIKAIKDILSGKRGSLITKLEKEMGQLARREEFDKAIKLRNKISDLKRVFENAKIIQKHSYTHISIYGYKSKKVRNNLVKILALPKMPVRIEGYDVSNIQGAHAAGSMVTFVNGRPDKNFYRKFKIYTKQSPNDTGMLKETLERRFKHDEWPFPDLILIDGGKGQVNTARTCLAALNITIPVIGISKNEHHLGHQLIIPGRKTPISLTKLSFTDKNLLLAIDSEAHRFAIGYYRKLHRKLFR